MVVILNNNWVLFFPTPIHIFLSSNASIMTSKMITCGFIVFLSDCIAIYLSFYLLMGPQNTLVLLMSDASSYWTPNSTWWLLLLSINIWQYRVYRYVFSIGNTDKHCSIFHRKPIRDHKAIKTRLIPIKDSCISPFQYHIWIHTGVFYLFVMSISDFSICLVHDKFVCKNALPYHKNSTECMPNLSDFYMNFRSYRITIGIGIPVNLNVLEWGIQNPLP